jgi:hypothetical protein
LDHSIASSCSDNWDDDSTLLASLAAVTIVSASTSRERALEKAATSDRKTSTLSLVLGTTSSSSTVQYLLQQQSSAFSGADGLRHCCWRPHLTYITLTRSESSHLFAPFSCLLDRVSPSAPPFRRVINTNRVRRPVFPGPVRNGRHCLQTAHPSSPSQRSLPYSCLSLLSPGALRHARLRLVLCCTAVTRNTQSPSPSCRTAAAADQTSPNQSINRTAGPSHLLPSPSRLRHPRLREWLDFPLPRSARPGSPVFTTIRPCKERKGSSSRISRAYHLFPHHCAAFTYANTLTHAVCQLQPYSPPTPSEAVFLATRRGRGHHKQQPVSAIIAHRP